jgi:hypothetical protein
MLRKNDTSARYVHAILAAAVDDPMLLDRLRRHSANPRKYSPAGVPDLDRLRLFAGLAIKVRQNDVRRRLPLTFKLLDKLKFSVSLFAAYAKEAAALRRAKKSTQTHRMRAISSFIEDWLDTEDPDHALVRDILHHERALFALDDRETRDATPDEATTAAEVTPRSVPWPVAGLICREMSCDPLALARLLRLPDSDLSTLRRGQFYYVYCRENGSGCVSAKEIDELGRVLLVLADGRRSVAQLSGVLRRAGIVLTRDQSCSGVQALVDNGLLGLRV